MKPAVGKEEMMPRLLRVCLCFILLAGLFSCDKRMPTQPEHGSGALHFSEEILPLENDEYIYRQSVEAGPELQEGLLFCWKVETLSGEAPSGWFANPDGWLWFRTSEGDSNIPLSQPGAHRTLWTSRSKLDFDFYSLDGKLRDLIVKVELRVKKADGTTSDYHCGFKSERLLSSRLETDFTEGAVTGAGLEFRLHEIVQNIYVEGLSGSHFMFRLNILNNRLEVISEGEWHSSLELRDAYRVKLGLNTEPALSPNAVGQYTQFESYLVSRQGLEEANPKSIYFRVRDGFQPQALIYGQTLVGLGQNHYSIDNTLHKPEFYNLIPQNGNRFNRLLWENETGWEAIHSPDLKLHLQWGFSGQFGGTFPGGELDVTNNPFDHELNLCVDANTGTSYYSQVDYFYLRFNAAPFPTQPHFVNPIQVTHAGKTWLRVKNLDHNAQSHIFSGLSPGDYQFEVCVVDAQGTVSEAATTTISLKPKVPFANRSGILIVDDSRGDLSLSPEEYVNNFYNTVIPTQWGAVQRYEIDPYGASRNISSVLLQQFKAVVWHSDNSMYAPNLYYSMDALEIYLDMEGALLISSTYKLATYLQTICDYYPSYAASRFGLHGSQDFGVLPTTKHYFIRSEAPQNQGNMNLRIDNAFNSNVRLRQGLCGISWFNYKSSWPYYHRFGCKAVDHPVYPPSQEEYDLYSNKYVGYQHGRIFVFGVPLSYLEPQDVAPAVAIILNRLLEPSKTSWRRK